MRAILHFVITASLLLCGGLGLAQDTTDNAWMLSAGEKLLKEGRFAEALVEFDKSLANPPNTSHTHMRRGYVLLQLGRPQEGLDALERARSMIGDRTDVPWYFPTLTYQAVALSMVGDIDASIPLFTEVIESMPNADAYHGRGRIYAQKGLYDLAAADFRSASQLAPGYEQLELAAQVLDEMHAGSLFIQQMAKTSGAVRTDSGLIYIEREPGAGSHPGATDQVKVHYHGMLRDGSVFDSSVDRGAPMTFPLDAVIPCWTEGVQKMRVGGRARLVCPNNLGYGPNGSGLIPPGAALQFDVELLGIEPAASGAP